MKLLKLVGFYLRKFEAMGSEELCDLNIMQEVAAYKAGVRYPLNLVQHTVQEKRLG